MKRGLLAGVLAALALPALAGPETWNFVRSVGGISVGSPFHSTDGWLLGVRANLSHGKAATAATLPLSCAKIQAAVEGSNIYLTLVSGPAGGPVAAVCPSARLGEVAAGPYKVFYRGPNEPAMPLREILIAP